MNYEQQLAKVKATIVDKQSQIGEKFKSQKKMPSGWVH